MCVMMSSMCVCVCVVRELWLAELNGVDSVPCWM